MPFFSHYRKLNKLPSRLVSVLSCLKETRRSSNFSKMKAPKNQNVLPKFHSNPKHLLYNPNIVHFSRMSCNLFPPESSFLDDNLEKMVDELDEDEYWPRLQPSTQIKNLGVSSIVCNLNLKEIFFDLQTIQSSNISDSSKNSSYQNQSLVQLFGVFVKQFSSISISFNFREIIPSIQLLKSADDISKLRRAANVFISFFEEQKLKQTFNLQNQNGSLIEEYDPDPKIGLVILLTASLLFLEALQRLNQTKETIQRSLQTKQQRNQNFDAVYFLNSFNFFLLLLSTFDIDFIFLQLSFFFTQESRWRQPSSWKNQMNSMGF